MAKAPSKTFTIGMRTIMKIASFATYAIGAAALALTGVYVMNALDRLSRPVTSSAPSKGDAVNVALLETLLKAQ
ncbi:MAG: hypothetical protein RLZZ324_1335, partial [Candidatus Parcubacteria bacterium]